MITTVIPFNELNQSERLVYNSGYLALSCERSYRQALRACMTQAEVRRTALDLLNNDPVMQDLSINGDPFEPYNKAKAAKLSKILNKIIDTILSNL